VPIVARGQPMQLLSIHRHAGLADGPDQPDTSSPRLLTRGVSSMIWRTSGTLHVRRLGVEVSISISGLALLTPRVAVHVVAHSSMVIFFWLLARIASDFLPLGAWARALISLARRGRVSAFPPPLRWYRRPYPCCEGDSDNTWSCPR
jgi:hypothetical protein